MAASFDCSNPNDLLECAKLIDEGGIVIFPTDTVYGIGCDPTNELAVIRLFELKNRPINKTLPLLTFSQNMVSKVAQISQPAKILMDKFWPGQLTLVLNSKTNKNIILCKYVFNASNNRSIALRVPGNQCIREIIRATKTKFLIGTSANISQQPSSKNFSELDMKLVSKCDAIVYNRNRQPAGTENDLTISKNGRETKEIQQAANTTELTTTNASNTTIPKNTPITDTNQLLPAKINQSRSVGRLSLTTKDSQTLKISSESTIIDLTNENKPQIIREGAVPKNKIIEALKPAR
jgi:L-threonylcarbamoyladenylate synthase